jgi:hypothetical protein
MPRWAMLTCLLALTVARPALAADATAYAAQAAAARAAQPDKVDWQALRFAYADSPDVDLVGDKTDAARKAMFQALNGGDANTAIVWAGRILAVDFADIDAHVVLNLAYQQAGQAAQAQREHETVVAILRSIRTGDGSSPAQAFTVISVGEEYQVMRAFAMSVKKQALVEANGHSYDRLDVVDGDGKAHTFFFLVDRVLAAEAKALKATR